MRRAAVALVVAGLVAVGCDGGETTAEPTADVLGLQLSEGSELEPLGPDEPASTTPTAPDAQPDHVKSTTVTNALEWGEPVGSGCVAIGHALTLDDEYQLIPEVRPTVDGDCPDWADSYDLGCIVTLWSAQDRPALIRGTVTFELLLDGETQATWSLDVDEQVGAGKSAEIRAGEKVPINAEGQPPVECRVTFTAA